MYYRILIIPCLLLTLKAVGDDYKPFYLRLGHGVNTIKPETFECTQYKGKVTLAHEFPSVEAAIGIQLDNTVRAELAYHYKYLFNSKECATNTMCDVYNITHKTKADSLMLNLLTDTVTNGDVTHFVGGGIGISSIAEKSNGTVYIQSYDVEYRMEGETKKRINKLTYRLITGIAISIAPDVTLEISYNYFDLGKNHISKRHYQVHNGTISVRFAL